jgi:hypothetical protein
MKQDHLAELAVRVLEALNAPTGTTDAIRDILLTVGGGPWMAKSVFNCLGKLPPPAQ